MEPTIFLTLCNGNYDLAWIVYIIAHVLLIAVGMALMMYFTYRTDKDAIERWPKR